MNYRQGPDSISQAKEYWQVIWLHKWSILLATVVLSAIAIVQISLLPDYYTASTMVLFDPQKLPEKYVAPTVTADPAQRLTTLTDEVLSPSRLQQVSRDLHLYADPSKISQRDMVEQMRKNITVEMKPVSEHEMSAFVISYTDRDPNLVAMVANRLADSFIRWDLSMRQQRATNTTEFLTDQLQNARQTLDREEATVADFKVKHSGELPEDVQANMQALYRLQLALQTNSDALDRLQQEKTLLTESPDSTLTTSAAPSERARLETVQRTLQAELTDLRTQYTEQYPDVITTKQRLEGVTKQLSQTAPESAQSSTSGVRLRIIDQQMERMQEEKKKLAAEINAYQSRIAATPVRANELEDLSRDYNSAKEQYRNLLDNRFNAGIAMDLERKQKASRFTVDPAPLPEKPIKPNRILLLAMALPFCLFIPAGSAVAISEVRRTVNSGRALRSLLPVAAHVIADIPMIETPSYLRRQRRIAMVSISGSLSVVIALAAFLMKVHPHL